MGVSIGVKGLRKDACMAGRLLHVGYTFALSGGCRVLCWCGTCCCQTCFNVECQLTQELQWLAANSSNASADVQRLHSPWLVPSALPVRHLPLRTLGFLGEPLVTMAQS
jgi:hypothetical protein